jgi:hypothetical protein
VLHNKPTWTRGLRLWKPAAGLHAELALASVIETLDDRRPHARSQFRSVRDPDRYALYAMREEGMGPGPLLELPGADDHTLIVVREFRRVPLYASALSLALFRARSGSGAPVVAALAHFVERAVSAWDPAYLLLAYSLEEPRLSMLLAGVHGPSALEAASASPLSLDGLLPELRAMLDLEPEVFTYCREEHVEDRPVLVSPWAV